MKNSFKVLFRFLGALILGSWTFASYAVSTNVYIDSRLDATKYNFEQKRTGTHDYSAFEVNKARLGVKGEVVKGYTYHLRYAFENTADNHLVDNASNALEKAYVQGWFDDHWSMQFGKDYLKWGTREQYLNETDVYTYSWASTNVSHYGTGVNLHYRNAGQKYYISINNSDDANSTPAKQKNFHYMISWYGNIIPEVIYPHLSYSFRPIAGRKHPDHYFFFGSNFLLGDLNIELDGGFLKKDRFKYMSGMAKIQFNRHGEVRPFVKAIFDKKVLHSESHNKRTAGDVGFEFFPFEGQDIRYHIVYSGGYFANDAVKDQNNEDYYQSSIRLGLKAGFDVIKGVF
ncbi:MAG: hypothetical protein HOE90_14760 [Bacteriovoracaceae bacterium]|jgi:hypothetical protein|nr:hypothetical protein [Bacteriovoracaceae bacterium]